MVWVYARPASPNYDGTYAYALDAIIGKLNWYTIRPARCPRPG